MMSLVAKSLSANFYFIFVQVSEPSMLPYHPAPPSYEQVKPILSLMNSTKQKRPQKITANKDLLTDYPRAQAVQQHYPHYMDPPPPPYAFSVLKSDPNLYCPPRQDLPKHEVCLEKLPCKEYPNLFLQKNILTYFGRGSPAHPPCPVSHTPQILTGKTRQKSIYDEVP